MCHIILFFPFASLSLFVFLPFEDALVWFIIINSITFFLFYKIYRAMKRRPGIGKAAMIGKEATVTETISPHGKISVGNELWFAISDARLERGQECVVTGFDGLKVVVKSKS